LSRAWIEKRITVLDRLHTSASLLAIESKGAKKPQPPQYKREEMGGTAIRRKREAQQWSRCVVHLWLGRGGIVMGGKKPNPSWDATGKLADKIALKCCMRPNGWRMACCP